jgi:hypothetical protein
MQIAHYLIRSILHVLYAYSIRDGISLYLIRSILHVLYAYSIRDGIFPCYTKQHTKYICMPKCIARWAQPLSMKIYSHASNQLLEIM